MLLRKLGHSGIRGVVHGWISSYLSKREQYAQFLDIESSYCDVVCGVPLGSILGPKLFILYINDICNVSNIFIFYNF